MSGEKRTWSAANASKEGGGEEENGEEDDVASKFTRVSTIVGLDEASKRLLENGNTPDMPILKFCDDLYIKMRSGSQEKKGISPDLFSDPRKLYERVDSSLHPNEVPFLYELKNLMKGYMENKEANQRLLSCVLAANNMKKLHRIIPDLPGKLFQVLILGGYVGCEKNASILGIGVMMFCLEEGNDLEEEEEEDVEEDVEEEEDSDEGSTNDDPSDGVSSSSDGEDFNLSSFV